MTDVTKADITLNGTKIGATGEDKTLQAKVRAGEYKATAGRVGYNTQAALITVESDGVTIPFYLGEPIAPSTPTAEKVAATPTPTPRPTPPPPSLEEVMKRFVDPAEAEKLTPDDWREVVTQSEKDLDREPNNAQSKARLHLGRGQIAFLSKNYPEALTQFTSAARELPSSSFSYYALGNTYLARNQHSLAAEMYQRAIRLSPDVAAVAYKKLGDAQSKMGKTKEANASYVKARQLGYASPEMIKSVALNLMRERQWKQALDEWNALAEKHPSAEVYVGIGECYENLKQPMRAHDAYKTATRVDPNSAVAHAKSGDVLYHLNEYREAKESYERALALDAAGAQIDRRRTRKQADAAAALSR